MGHLFWFRGISSVSFIIAFVMSCDSGNRNLTQLPEEPSVTTISKKSTPPIPNLKFENTIIENVETLENLFNYDYFYNGAGVGVEDINNDGLLDIFFCGNQVNNKLFLNKGNLIFEDITETANINTGKVWSNGVAFVDINNDGWMDMYVSQGGPNKRLQRKNLLFINQKDNTFTENAESYGLARYGNHYPIGFF